MRLGLVVAMTALTAIGAVLPVAAAPLPKDRPPDPFAWAYMGIRVDTTNSMQVASTDVGTPANLAGILPNDIIVRVGMLTPQSFDDVAVYIISLRPGTKVIMEVRRDGALIQMPMVLGERPIDAPLPTILLKKLYNKTPQLDDP